MVNYYADVMLELSEATFYLLGGFFGPLLSAQGLPGAALGSQVSPGRYFPNPGQIGVREATNEGLAVLSLLRSKGLSGSILKQFCVILSSDYMSGLSG